MQTPLYKRGLIITSLVMAGVVLMPLTVSANEGHSPEEHRSSRAQERRDAVQTTTETQQQRATEAKETRTERREAAETRLESAKLRACQNREKASQSIMMRIADRSTKQLDVFTKIADRTQVFYESKGNVAEGYGELVADVADKKATAESAISTIESMSGSFSCESDDPKGVMVEFKTALQTRNTVLKEYKTAIKDLIVAVKSAQSTAAEPTTEGVE